MDQVYPFARDHAFQFAFIPFQRDRILGFGVHPEQLTAQGLEGSFLATAPAGQQSPSASLYDGFGDFEHGTLHPTSRQFRGHLENGLASQIRKIGQVVIPPLA
jgi:hypothetical protein